MLTTTNISYRFTQASLKGARESQQDTMLSVRITDFAGEQEWHVLGVFDGVGGHADGALASRTAADSFLRAFSLMLWSGGAEPNEDHDIGVILLESLKHANASVYELGHGRELRPATTAVVAVLSGQAAMIAHVGDSPAALVDEDSVSVLTEAHADESGRLSRCLGIREEVEPGLTRVDVHTGHRLLLMSDGVSGVLTDADLIRLADDARCLVEESILFGSTDNCTAVCACIQERVAETGLSETRHGTVELVAGDRISIGGVRVLIEPATALATAPPADPATERATERATNKEESPC